MCFSCFSNGDARAIRETQLMFSYSHHATIQLYVFCVSMFGRWCAWISTFTKVYICLFRMKWNIVSFWNCSWSLSLSCSFLRLLDSGFAIFFINCSISVLTDTFWTISQGQISVESHPSKRPGARPLGRLHPPPAPVRAEAAGCWGLLWGPRWVR